MCCKVHVVGGTLGMGGGREDRALVLLQHLQPVRQVGRMIGLNLGRDAEIRTQKSRTQFGHQFLEGIGAITEAPAELARVAVGVARPVDQLVGLGGRVAFSIAEGLGRRQLDEVPSRGIEGSATPMAERGAGGRKERLGGLVQGQGLQDRLAGARYCAGKPSICSTLKTV